MLFKIGAALAAVPLAMVGVVAGTGVVVVDVRPSDGPHIVIPVPLMLAEVAARLAPADSTRHAMRQLERAQRYLPLAEEIVAAVAEAPDAELVSVDDGDEHVRISKVGEEIRIRVEGPRENVTVNVPIEAVRDTLRKAHHGGRLYPEDFVAMLRHARMTDLVEVHDGQDHVKISVW
jgi:hypothetical protein